MASENRHSVEPVPTKENKGDQKRLGAAPSSRTSKPLVFPGIKLKSVSKNPNVFTPLHDSSREFISKEISAVLKVLEDSINFINFINVHPLNNLIVLYLQMESKFSKILLGAEV